MLISDTHTHPYPESAVAQVPDELLEIIFRQAPKSTLASLGAVSKRFHTLTFNLLYHDVEMTEGNVWRLRRTLTQNKQAASAIRIFSADFARGSVPPLHQWVDVPEHSGEVTEE
ncbi:hypothetical protein BDN67DRAFT_975254 [Paxillus ammoniavirescens]|nr:hypothetical protein BDN67DRAFT_975254 [Paxillus ammoniavirescens]